MKSNITKKSDQITIDELGKWIKNGFIEAHNDLIETKTELHRELVAVKNELQQEMASVKTELQQEIASVKSGLHQEIIDVKTELRQEIVGVKTELQLDIIKAKDEIVEEMNNRLTNIKSNYTPLRMHGILSERIRKVEKKVG